ncbi:hypothetical protein P4571_06470 [Niallia alba]|jgi:hypothetical protein|uniref:hypothetical protein n=1 Tax=Niallia alba TaxID=2729105 RepID=UPI002E23B8F5|nr:hypothetical protein [Niallia alba]
MIINLNEYRNKHRKAKKKSSQFVKIPVYERVYMDGNKLIGECSNGYKAVIKEYNDEK